MNKSITILIFLLLHLSLRTTFCAQTDSVDYYKLQANQFVDENPKKALYNINKAYLYLHNKNAKGKFVLDLIKGKVLTALGQYDSSAIYLHDALTYYKSKQDTSKELTVMHAVALNLDLSGRYDEAVSAYFEVVKIGELTNQLSYVAGAYSNIGILLKLQGNFEEAKEIYIKVLAIDSALKDTLGMAADYNNLAGIYEEYKEYKTALDYYNKGLEYSILANSMYGKAMSYGNLGSIYYYLRDFESAIDNCLKGIDVYTAMDYEIGKIDIYRNLGNLYLKINQPKQSLEYLLKAEKIANMIQDIQAHKKLYYDLSLTYANLNKPEKAYQYLQKYSFLKDSLFKDNSAKQIAEMQEKYNSDKKDSEIKILNKDKELSEVQLKAKNLQLKQERSQRITLYGGLGLMILFGAFMVNRYRVTRKQKNIIEKQKDIVEEAHFELEEKNKEITDSIKYAKRIQSAILPPKKVVKEYLQQSFILYKPKDIVAGDFYWLETVHNVIASGTKQSAGDGQIASDSSSPRNDVILFAAADCTGHGVPGAMVSVICNNGLNRSVREHGLTDPGEILDKTREIVIAEFEKSEEEVKDGMDIALCSLKFEVRGSKLKKTTSAKNPSTSNIQPQTTALLQYAGAHNPLWIIRNGEIIETKADKEPIGKFDKQTPYTTHTFELQKGDTIYIFSDGYVDQFGGDRGKKFKAKAFRELLLSIQNENMEKQHNTIDEAFENWKGDVEQIDDVCVIGVRI